MKDKKTRVELYNGDGKYTFLNVTMWDVFKFWIITKLTGGAKPMDRA
tara:strand:- start:92 stop:232 length:141 start_codon:yes stop_codon:yes gene_type:complete